VSAANHGFSIATKIIGKANAGSEVCTLRSQEGAAVILAGEVQTAGESERILLIGIEVRSPAVSFIGRLLVIVTKAEVEFEARSEAPVILNESAEGEAFLRFTDIGSDAG